MKIIDEMVEAAAKAIHEIEDSQYETPRWDDLTAVEQGGYLRMSRVIIEAALAVATEPVDHTELIAEAKGRGCPHETCPCDGRLIRRLADALEGATK